MTLLSRRAYPPEVQRLADDVERALLDLRKQLGEWIDTRNVGRWEDLRFPTQGINPPGTASDPARDTATGLLNFSATVTNIIAGVAQIPHGRKPQSPISPHLHLRANGATPSAGVDACVWQLEQKWYNNFTPVPWAYTTTEAVITLPPNSGSQPITVIGNFPDMDGAFLRDSSIIEWKVSRLGGDARDTYAGTVALLEFDFHVLVDAVGSIAEAGEL